jgi:hypothetical protein
MESAKERTLMGNISTNTSSPFSLSLHSPHPKAVLNRCHIQNTANYNEEQKNQEEHETHETTEEGEKEKEEE